MKYIKKYIFNFIALLPFLLIFFPVSYFSIDYEFQQYSNILFISVSMMTILLALIALFHQIKDINSTSNIFKECIVNYLIITFISISTYSFIILLLFILSDPNYGNPYCTGQITSLCFSSNSLKFVFNESLWSPLLFIIIFFVVIDFIYFLLQLMIMALKKYSLRVTSKN